MGRPSQRQAILDAAVEVFAEGGARGSSLSDVGARAGVTHTAVLYHFGSSADLLTAVLDERDRRMQVQLAHLLEGDLIDVLGRLPEIARHNAENIELVRLYITLLTESFDPLSATNEWFLERSRDLRHHLETMIEHGIADGSVHRDVQPRAKAAEIVAFMEGAHLLALLDPVEIDLVELFETFRDSLVHSLAPDDGNKETP